MNSLEAPGRLTLVNLLARPAKRLVVMVLGLSIAINLLTVQVSLYSMQVFDRVFASGSLATLALLTLITVVAIAVMGVFDLLRAQLLTQLGNWIDVGSTQTAIWRLVGGGAKASIMRDIAQVRAFVAGPGAVALCDAPWSPLFLAMLFLIDPLLGLVGLAGAALLVGLALFNERAGKQLFTDAAAAHDAATAEVQAALAATDAIRAMGLGRGLSARWRALYAEAATTGARAADVNARVLSLAKSARLIVQIAIYAVGAWLVLSHQVGAGALIAASFLLSRALAPIEQAVALYKQAVEVRQAERRIGAMLAEAAAQPVPLPLPAPIGKLSAENLCYAPNGTTILADIDFVLEPGTAVGIVGASGAGKSTLARLLVGALQPTSGVVRLDGAALHDWPGNQIGPALGYLPQDMQLVAGRIQDVIARHVPEGDPAEIVRAARRAGIHELILRLPQGYGTMLQAGGAPLSGGQRQLLGLARALYGTPKLLVLDEPNAALDRLGEKVLADTVAGLKAMGSTVVIIGHRPTTLAHVDRIIALESGRIVFDGPRAEFAAAPPVRLAS